jgi:hypothetical protein
MPIVGQFGSLAGFGVFPGGALESIATVTVGSGGVATATLSSIPSTYQHLQVRISTTGTLYLIVKPNGSACAISHRLLGNGSAAQAGSNSGTPYAGYVLYNESSTTAAAAVVDILDYGSTSKTKTIRSFTGADFNGSGAVQLMSSLWNSTSAITSLDFVTDTGGNVPQGCTIALYGVRA